MLLYAKTVLCCQGHNNIHYIHLILQKRALCRQNQSKDLKSTSIICFIKNLCDEYASVHALELAEGLFVDFTCRKKNTWIQNPIVIGDTISFSYKNSNMTAIPIWRKACMFLFVHPATKRSRFAFVLTDTGY